MFRTARRLATVALAAVAIVFVTATASATPQPQPQPHHTLYRHFCPLSQADVAAAGPYFAATQSEPKSSRP